MKTVFCTYEPLVRSIARNGFDGFPGLSHPADLDDAVSSVFVAAFDPACRNRYDTRGPYHAFLSGVARNTLRSLRRKTSREMPFDPETSQALPDPLPSNPEEELAVRQNETLSHRFREHLGDPFLEGICTNTFALGMSEQQVADSMNVTRHQVRKALGVIRKRMLSFLHREGLA